MSQLAVLVVWFGLGFAVVMRERARRRQQAMQRNR
jgi:hypothetical protein